MNLGEIEAAMRLMEDTIADVVVLVVKRGEPQQAVVAFCRPSEFFVIIITLGSIVSFYFREMQISRYLEGFLFLRNILYHGATFFPRTT